VARNSDLNQRMRDERREKILSVALRLFVGRGLAATKIADIARDGEMAQGLVYHYFASKEAIYTELVGFALSQMRKACDYLEATPPEAPAAKIARALEALLHGLNEASDTSLYYLLVSQARMSESLPEETRKILASEIDYPQMVIARIMAAGQKEGTIAAGDVNELAMLFWSVLKGLAMQKGAVGENFHCPNVQIVGRLFFVDFDFR